MVVGGVGDSIRKITNEDDAAEILLLIRDSFIPAFVALEQTLQKKMEGIDEEQK